MIEKTAWPTDMYKLVALNEGDILCVDNFPRDFHA